mmetsp:Transcript_9829/g.17887  ORF Transcript_9829/g.17887 Transcript_9829/m.17887 type:complete len:236 (-) Transcript_9829:481-1188(-)
MISSIDARRALSGLTKNEGAVGKEISVSDAGTELALEVLFRLDRRIGSTATLPTILNSFNACLHAEKYISLTGPSGTGGRKKSRKVSGPILPMCLSTFEAFVAPKNSSLNTFEVCCDCHLLRSDKYCLQMERILGPCFWTNTFPTCGTARKEVILQGTESAAKMESIAFCGKLEPRPRLSTTELLKSFIMRRRHGAVVTKEKGVVPRLNGLWETGAILLLIVGVGVEKVMLLRST